CENPAIRWDFKVRHYSDDRRQARDTKYEPGQGVLYPRAAALGGCTAHNAMIFMLPHDSDWDHIAQLTGDRSWLASRMRRYARMVEACHHRPLWRALRRCGMDFSGHGWNGWLRTERAMPHEAFADDELMDTLAGTARSFVSGLPLRVARVLRWFWNRGDPNARTWFRRSYEGICYTPMATAGRRRTGTRERLLQVVADHPGLLHIELDALATRVIFDDRNNATGVEYLKGKYLYRAHAVPNAEPGELHQVSARREVVLCGGAFNTPQLLQLSGIGAAHELRKHDIPVRVDLPAVGRNLQDRYEVAVTHRMRRPWKVLEGARFERNDPLWKLWQESRSGMYTSNGSAIAIVSRSEPSAPEPDIFCMALLARFEGYFSGFSKLISAHKDYLTWAILKAHTNNRAGVITLRSADPRDTPLVNFNYFEDGDDATGADLQAVVNGVKFVRRITAPLIAQKLIAEEKMPGTGVATDADIADYVRNTAWGHHASCSCAIGPAGANSVLDSNFAVRGVRRLRVVDASVFPRIPGFFVVSAVYMIAEKAAEVMLEAAAGTPEMNA
ncbi:MAG TPA: GMC oxidoreductase, partial [Burkholderiales bacterium]|nr:GMC oxidoreductase [Burkholderiales bacterium]